MRRLGWAVAVATVAASAAISTSAAAPAATPIALSGSGANGEGLIDRPGVPCAEGGEGASWHYDYESALAPGAFTQLPGELRLHLDLHSEPSGAPVATYDDAWLPGTESFVTVANQRGVVRMALQSGAGRCDAPNLAFDGTTASGTGTWEVVSSSGSYRDATGAGTFDLRGADVAPGADNPFDIALAGSLTVPQPDLTVEVVDTYWGFMGADYLLRRPTVLLKVTNAGEGDAFAARMTKATSPTKGTKVLGPVPQHLADLHGDLDGPGGDPGDSELIRVRVQLGLLEPCKKVLLGCEFQLQIGGHMNDALDVSRAWTRTVTAHAPDLPPPL